MNEFSAQVFALINADKPEQKPVRLKTITVRESTWFEEQELRLLDFKTGADHSMLVDLQDNLNAMQTKVQCRRLLAATGYTQAGQLLRCLTTCSSRLAPASISCSQVAGATFRQKTGTVLCRACLLTTLHSGRLTT